MHAFWTVVRKEFVDALRDRRTWMVVLATSVLTGPVLMLLLTSTLGDLRSRAERGEVMVRNIDQSPEFDNYLQRRGKTVIPVPPDYEAQIRAGRFDNAVVILPDAMSQKLDAGIGARVQIVHDGHRSRSASAARSAESLVRGFADELGLQRTMARGIAPALSMPARAQLVDLGSSRGATGGLLFLVPFIAMFASLAGTLTVAIDVTSGERERGSLEPLLMNPIDTTTVMMGKWLAVASAAIATLTLTLLSFAVAARFIKDEMLAAVFQFGWTEAGLFAVMLVPFCALMAAFMMFTAVFAHTYKEAQAYSSYTMTGVGFAMALPLYLALPDAAWQLFVPAMGQNMVLTRALRGAPVSMSDVVLPGALALGLAAVLIALQGRLLRRETIVFARG